jgi:hypothetical protein
MALKEDGMKETATGLCAGPLFVVGMWRSGTSLLYALLNQHSQIALMYEAELPVLRPLFWGRRGKADWAERWNFWNSALERHKIAVADISAPADDVPSAVREVYGQYALRKGATIWGGKSPNYYDYLTRLANDFPEARFIVIWRDPADICRSILRAAEKDTWFGKKGIPHRALFGMHRMKRDCDLLVSRGVPVHEIEYEDLIHQPAEVMHGICDFLGIPFEPRMTSLEGADRSTLYEGEHHEGVKSGMIREKVQRPEILSPALSEKIDRYVSLWRRQSKGRWPPACRATELSPPGRFERMKDQVVFRAMRMLDATVVAVYCFTPLSMLKKYRERKAQRAAPAAVVAKSAQSVSAD